MEIYLKTHFTLLGSIHSDEEKHYKFNVTMEGNVPVEVHIYTSETPDNSWQIESFCKTFISSELKEALEENVERLSEELETEFMNIQSCIKSATERILVLIKYELRQVDIQENLFSLKDYFWSIDNNNWNKARHYGMRITTLTRGLLPLTKKTEESIQEKIQSDYKPFFALKHLHRARSENNPRYKWIDATIAAELAIKEFLIQHNPKLEPLLLELPSPPLHLLYGRILKSYINEESPKKNELSAGYSKRNKLIHRPKEVDISLKEADDYVSDVEDAILHLLTKLYPDDILLKSWILPNKKK